MPAYDMCCDSENCGHVFEQITPFSQYQDTLPCPQCGADSTRRYFTAQQSGIMGAPTVVFKDETGKIFYPGSASEATPSGCQRIELTTMKQRRDFAAQQDNVAREQWERRMSGESEHYNRVLHEGRADLAATLRTNYGKDFARVAIEQNNARMRKRYNQSYVPGSRFEIAE